MTEKIQFEFERQVLMTDPVEFKEQKEGQTDNCFYNDGFIFLSTKNGSTAGIEAAPPLSISYLFFQNINFGL